MSGKRIDIETGMLTAYSLNSIGVDPQHGFHASYTITQPKEVIEFARMQCPTFTISSTSIDLKIGYFSLYFVLDEIQSPKIKSYDFHCCTVLPDGTFTWSKVASLTTWDIAHNARLKHHFVQGNTYYFSLQVIFESGAVGPFGNPQLVTFYPTGSGIAGQTGDVFYKFLCLC